MIEKSTYENLERCWNLSEKMMGIPLINKLIEQAYEHSERRFFINKKKEAELFFKLNLINDKGAIPSLFPLVLSQNKRLARTVIILIHRILIQIPIDQLEALDERIRKDNYFYWGSQINVSNIKRLNLEKTICNSMFVLLCFHNNGYIREQAIKELLPKYSGLNIPILLIRANDWVENIKQVAVTKLIELINNNTINEFVPSLGLIGNLYKKERYDHSVLISAIENKLINESYDKLLWTIIYSNKNLSRVAFRIAVKDTSKLSQLIKASSQSNDLIIKLETLKLANQILKGDKLFEFLCRWLKDKSSIIRRKCIYILSDQFPKQINAILTSMLFDNSILLRELARFYLKKNGINNFDYIYKEALINKNKALNISIMGLAEIGIKDDFKLIEPYINDAKLNIRSACIYATFKIKPENKQELIMSQLPSKERMILKAIYTGLIKYYDDFDINAIEQEFCQHGDLYCKKLLIKLKLATIKGWNLIDYILDTVLKVQNENIKLLLERKISQWIIKNSPNRIFIKPDRNFLIQIIIKVDKLISKNENANLYNALKKNIMFFI